MRVLLPHPLRFAAGIAKNSYVEMLVNAASFVSFVKVLAAPQGFEPRLTDPESVVLPVRRWGKALLTYGMLGFKKLPELSYQLVRSRKRYRSMSLQINHEGLLVVSVPWHVSRQVVDNFVQSKSQWITKKIKQLPEQTLEVSSEKKAWCLANALSEFQKRVEYFSNLMQLYPTHLTVSKARTRWGSCTAQNHVRLNWRLMLLAPEILDAVVVHELAHIREKNHSRRFWMLVAQFDPNFREHRAVLKRHSYLLSL